MKNIKFFLISVIGLQISFTFTMQGPKFEEVAELDATEFEQLLKKVPSLVRCSDENGKTLLMYATQHHKNAHLDALLESGAEVNVRDEQGRNALHFAAVEGNVHAAVQLVKKDINTKAVTVKGDTPLHHLLKNDERAADAFMTAKAILFSYCSKNEEPKKWYCNYSLLELKNNNNETPVDNSLHWNNFPVIVAFFRYAEDTRNVSSPEYAELDTAVAKRVKDKILQKFNYGFGINWLLSRQFSSLWAWHCEQNEFKAELKKKEEEIKKLKKLLGYQL